MFSTNLVLRRCCLVNHFNSSDDFMVAVSPMKEITSCFPSECIQNIVFAVSGLHSRI